MKKFNFRKLGILIAMMLVCGMFLVGSASAYNESMELSGDGEYWISSAGNLIFGDFVSYSGYVWTVNSNPADVIGIQVRIYSDGKEVYRDPSSGYSWAYDTNEHEVSGVFMHDEDLIDPYIKTIMVAYGPDDAGIVTVYDI